MIDAMLAGLGLAIDMDNLDEPLKQIGDGVRNTSMRVYDAYDSNEGFERKAPATDLILTSRDWVFVKEMIINKPLVDPRKRPPLLEHESGFIGRPHIHQEFLYDIVANRHSGLDVDKIDYFARDDRRAFRGSGQIDVRLIDEVTVSWGVCSRPGKCFRCQEANPRQHMMICYPEKLAEGVARFFHNRMRLHSSVYTHKTTQASTFMIADILALADPFFRLKSDVVEEDPKLQALPLSHAMLNPNIYGRMRDSVIDLIEADDDPRLKPAQDVIRRLHSRDMYKCVGTKKIDMTQDTPGGEKNTDLKLWGMTNVKNEKVKRQNTIEDELFSLRGRYPNNTMLEREDIMAECRSIHMGAGEANPLNRMRFLPRHQLRFVTRERLDELPEARELPEENFNAHLPRSVQENSIRAFCRSGSKDKCELLGQVFHLWEDHCEQQYSGGIQTFDEQPGDSDEPAFIALTQEEEPGSPVPEWLSPEPVAGKNTPASTEPARAPKRLGFD